MPEAEQSPASTLRLRSFQAMHFDPERVGDLSAVTSPPYDVMDRAMIQDLLSSNPRNVVRLILPRLVNEPLVGGDPYLTAARRLARWRRQGTLVTDPQPGLYVYEYGDSAHRVCGVVGALELSRKDHRAILPHEDVIPAIVADRMAMMQAARANLEPILLVYHGDGVLSDQLAKARSEQPLEDLTATDGTFHRVWEVTDKAAAKAMRHALRPQHALIADGHHRYAIYRRFRRDQHAAGHGRGPWDRGLALLIDDSEFPLQLGAIHRSLAEISLDALTVPRGYTISPPTPLGSADASPPEASGRLVVTDGVSVRTVELPAPAEPHVTDVERLHAGLLPHWDVSEFRVGYHHTAEQAVHEARQEDGVAVLLYPATVAEVMAVARSGRVMPRKSTSFGPKPRMGLLMRSLDDER